MATPLNWRRSQFKALEGSAHGSYSKPSRLESVLVPDIAAATWLPFASREHSRLVRESVAGLRDHDRSGPLGAPRGVGAASARDSVDRRVPRWVDVRPACPRVSTSLQRQLDASLERRVATGADALVAVTQPIADDLVPAVRPLG
jgi:hypothetical protein